MAQREPGGVFQRFRFATTAEVRAFFEGAGIVVSTTWSSENLAPVMALMGYVGITSNQGNLGGGNFFDYTAGGVESGPSGAGKVSNYGLHADPEPTAEARVSYGGGPDKDGNHTGHGSWLVVSADSQYVVAAKEKIKIGGRGCKRGKKTPTVTLEMWNDGTLYWNSTDDGWYPGSFETLDAKGRKLSLQFNEGGAATYQAAIIDWSGDLCDAPVTAVPSIDIRKFKAKLNKTQTAIKVNLKSRATANTDAGAVTVKHSLKAKGSAP